MGEVVLINKNFTKGLSLRGYKVNDFKKLEIFKNIDFCILTNSWRCRLRSLSKFSSRPCSRTLAPAFATALAIDHPSPRLDPVIKTIWFSSENNEEFIGSR